MNNEFSPYEQALELKKLGFNEECLAFYNSTFRTPNELLYPQYGGEVGNWNVENHLISAPLYQQAFRWFREKYKLHTEIRTYTEKYFTIIIQECKDIVKYIEYGGIDLKFNTYEEAELACLKKLIEIVESKSE